MPINFRWHKQDSILYVEHIGRLTSDELDEAIGAVIRYLDAATRPIHFILDWRQTHGYPLQFSMVSTVMIVLRHTNLGSMALIGVNPSVTFWLEFFKRLIKVDYRLFDNVDDAAQYLLDIDQPQQQASC